MPPLHKVTPVILTFNEVRNIDRTASRLQWATRVVVVDSGSDDGTVEILQTLANADVFQRDFDTHQKQWNFALQQVATEWTLALDADYLVPEELLAEIREIPDDTPKNGFFVEFDYAVLGHLLRRNLYPARQVLFRSASAFFEEDGHTQRVHVNGPSGRLKHRIIHDDRKPLERWLWSQTRYAFQEAEKLRSTSWSQLSWPDRIRRTGILGPLLVAPYTLLVKGVILDGWAGWYYALERTAAETMLSLVLLRTAVEPTS